MMVETGLTTHTPTTIAADLELAGIVPLVPWVLRIEEHPAWAVLSRLPVTITVAIPLSRFRVRDLLGLAEGQVFESISSDTNDVPLNVGDVQLGWTEFEVVGQKIAVRLTRLV
jgi:flagellar motor switch/type III secretory pathway protein FliN